MMNKTINSLILLLLVLAKGVLTGEEAAPLKGIRPYAGSVNVITGEYCEGQTDLTLEGPRPFSIKRCFFGVESCFACDGLAWHFNHPNILSANIGNLPEFQLPDTKIAYVNDAMDRLSEVKVTNLSESRLFHECRFSYEDEGETNLCRVEAGDGRSIAYRYDDNLVSRGTPGITIHQFIDVAGNVTDYTYRQHPMERKMLIKKCMYPGGGWLETEYYEGKHNNVGGTLVTISDPVRDPRIGRIKLQKAPVGPAGEPVITQKFFYHNGYTEVVRSNNLKEVYRYSEDGRITAIETHLPEEGGYQLYKAERLYWSRESESEEKRLISRTLEDAKGRIHFCKTFEYDTFGNLIKEAKYGNTSGTCSSAITIKNNGLPENNCAECSVTHYEYSQKDAKSPSYLVKKVEPMGKTTRYLYDLKSGQKTGELICDGEEIRIRQFYLYDQHGLLVETITDDGTSEDPSDLHGVTERHIARFTLGQEKLGNGMPEVIEERCFDMKTGTERTLKTTYNTYSPQNKVIRQDIFDGNGCYVCTKEQDFDLFGRHLFQSEGTGMEHAYEYDAIGNKVLEKQTNEGVLVREARHTYDLANRLIRTVEIDEEGTETVTAYRYDAMSRKVASIDAHGNETRYDYDSLGRLTKVVHPTVLGPDGGNIQPTVHNSYDVAGNVIATTDPNGYVTRTKYNINGDPILISHSDGTEERFEYSLDGCLVKQVAKNGLTTVFKRDFLGRIVAKELFSPSGDRLSIVTNEYNAFHKIASTDVNGVTTVYDYDCAGRQAAVTKATEEGIHRKEFEYDAAGRVYCEKEWYGDNAHDYIATFTERDSSGAVMEMRIENAFGEVLRRKQRDEPGHDESTLTARKLEHFNSRGQQTQQKIVTDDNGITTTMTFDALGRMEKSTKSNSFGETFQEIEMRYDPSGNKVKEIHTLFSGDENHGSYIIAWKYGPGNRLKAVTEGEGSRQQKTTTYHYNACGQLETITKPDRVRLHHQYNSQGHIARITASDGTVDLEYRTDISGNIIEANDYAQQTHAVRYYNSNNLLTYESIDGFAVSHAYDRCGRKVGTSLPDGSSIYYRYDGVNLVEVGRCTPSQELLYSHKYRSYDLQGRVLDSELIQGLGTLRCSYSSTGLCTSIQTPYWSEHTEWTHLQGPIRTTVVDPLGEETASFQYDAKGQVTEEAGSVLQTYLYDTLGNRQSKNGKKYTINDANEVTSDSDNDYIYDTNGNVVKKVEGDTVYTYRYDALNRLVEAAADGSAPTVFKYDPFSRRIGKKGEHHEEIYFYDGNSELGTLDTAGTITTLRVLGRAANADIGAAVAIERHGRLFAPIHDRVGSVRCLVDAESGEVAEFYRFTAFGEEEIYSGDGEKVDPNEAINPWRYFSKRHENETGLIFFGKRYYDPAMGRWTTMDPLGCADGPNRYQFVHNNPLSNFDHYGHLTWSDIWGGVIDAISSCFNWVMDLSSKLFGAIRSETQFLQHIQPSMTEMFEKYFGKGFLTFNGYYSHPMESGVYGQGEVAGNVRITLINGIANVRSYYRDSLELLNSTHGGVNIHYIFRPTEGWCGDFIKAMLIKFGYVSPYARELASTWKKLIDEMGGVEGGGMIIHYCHSLGGADTATAASLLTPEERKMIHVISIGSATVIPDSTGYGSVSNYVSVRDGIFLADPYGYLKGAFSKDSNVYFIGSFLGIPLIDHSLGQETYTALVTNLGNQFLAMYAYAGGFL